MDLKNKKILITAGPTWVSIDSVRVISNTATGHTGLLLADKLSIEGAKVTVLLGPVVKPIYKNRKINIIDFCFFDELKYLLRKHLSTRQYGVVIHSAAVADYQPEEKFNGKIQSGFKRLNLKMVPTVKLIDGFKRIDPKIFLVGFKFEPEAKEAVLVREARELIKRSGADIIVANTTYKGHYSAKFVFKTRVSSTMVKDKNKLVDELVDNLKAENSLK